jgi:hypothetical protein
VLPCLTLSCLESVFCPFFASQMRRRERGDPSGRRAPPREKSDPGRYEYASHFAMCVCVCLGFPAWRVRFFFAQQKHSSLLCSTTRPRHHLLPLQTSRRSNQGVEARNKLDEEDVDTREPHVRSAEMLKHKAELYERLGMHITLGLWSKQDDQPTLVMSFVCHLFHTSIDIFEQVLTLMELFPVFVSIRQHPEIKTAGGRRKDIWSILHGNRRTAVLTTPPPHDEAHHRDRTMIERTKS